MSAPEQKGPAVIERIHDENGTRVLWRNRVIATGAKAQIISAVAAGAPIALLGLATYKYPFVMAAGGVGAITGASFATGTHIVKKNGVIVSQAPYRVPPPLGLVPLAASAFVLWKAPGLGAPVATGVCAGLAYALGNTFRFVEDVKSKDE